MTEADKLARIRAIVIIWEGGCTNGPPGLCKECNVLAMGSIKDALDGTWEAKAAEITRKLMERLDGR